MKLPFNMQLVDNAGDMWKAFSMRALILIAAIQAIWASVPPEVQSMIPESAMTWITFALAIIGAIGRVIKQANITPTLPE